MIELHIANNIDPIRSNEPLQATMMNMSAAINNNLHFFILKDVDDNQIALRIERVDYIKERD